jgi:hypothetical protein
VERLSRDRWWVEYEIKTTLEKERALRNERGKPVHKLVPLNRDGYMFTDQWDLGVLANDFGTTNTKR